MSNPNLGTFVSPSAIVAHVAHVRHPVRILFLPLFLYLLLLFSAGMHCRTPVRWPQDYLAHPEKYFVNSSELFDSCPDWPVYVCEVKAFSRQLARSFRMLLLRSSFAMINFFIERGGTKNPKMVSPAPSPFVADKRLYRDVRDVRHAWLHV